LWQTPQSMRAKTFPPASGSPSIPVFGINARNSSGWTVTSPPRLCAKEITASLQRKRAYLSTARLRNRPRLPKTAAQCTVLVVEDDPDQAALADVRVSMAGYNVRMARTRREMFTDLITKPAPDAVLLDIMLPDGDGFQILAGMRRHPKFALIPVIMLTAKTEADDIQRGLRLGADAYITKPYSREVVADTLLQVLRHA